jgi:hypothetical protein
MGFSLGKIVARHAFGEAGPATDVDLQDPQPEPPESFTEPRRVQRLVHEMKGLPSEHPACRSGLVQNDP